MRTRQGGASVGIILVVAILAIVGVIGYMQYTKHEMAKRFAEMRQADEARMRAEKEAAEEAKREREEAAEEAARKAAEEKARQAREDAVEAARKERQKARAAELAEKERKAKESEAIRQAFQHAVEQFEGKSVGVEDDEMISLKDEGEEAYCVLGDFGKTGIIYAFKNENGKMEIRALTKDAAAEEVSEAVILAKIKKGLSATVQGDEIDLRGVAKNRSLYALPKAEKDFCPAQVECKDLYLALVEMGASFEEMKCRISLVQKNGNRAIQLGVISYDGIVDWEVLQEKGEELILASRKSKAKNTSSKVKLKKFKPTVVYYDGDMIRKDIHGVTHVPRVFAHKGTSNYQWKDWRVVSEFRRKWEILCREAERQEAKAREVAAENERRLSAAEREQLRQEREMTRVSDADLEKELGKWRLMVDRGKIKRQ